MATEHNVLTDPELHEPKGVAAASVDQVYVTNGSGSGAHTSISAITASEYGVIYTAGGSTASAAITTAVKLELFASDGVGNIVVPDQANNQITLTTAGDYDVSFNTSYTGSVSNVTWEFHARLDGVETYLGIHRKVGTGSDVGACGFSGIITATAGQQLSIYASASTSSTITPIDMQLSAVLLKEA